MSGKNARRLWFGLLTVLGLAERGVFIPHRYAAHWPRAGERPPYAAAEALFKRREPEFRALLALLERYGEDLMRIGTTTEAAGAAGAAGASGPRWGQSWFPRLDAAAAYALVRSRAPGLILEVGSGHSTRFFARAVADGGLKTRILAIDPAPRAALAGLPLELRRASLQEVLRGDGPSPFEALGPGDVLSIDSSHILQPGSDVDLLLGHVLPALPPGVLVQIHDIFLPEDYPRSWDWRGYNEQLGVLPLLLGGRFEVLFSSRYAVTRMGPEFERSPAARLPLGRPGEREVYESSLWLRTLEAAP